MPRPSAITAALVVAAAAVLGSASNASGASSYCSRSGDICFGIVRVDGHVVFRLNAFAQYFRRYRLCVRSPRGRSACRTFPLRKTGRLYGSRVRWRGSFPTAGPGIYRVTWLLGRERLGPTLAFRAFD